MGSERAKREARVSEAIVEKSDHGCRRSSSSVVVIRRRHPSSLSLHGRTLVLLRQDKEKKGGNDNKSKMGRSNCPGRGEFGDGALVDVRDDKEASVGTSNVWRL